MPERTKDFQFITHNLVPISHSPTSPKILNQPNSKYVEQFPENITELQQVQLINNWTVTPIKTEVSYTYTCETSTCLLVATAINKGAFCNKGEDSEQRSEIAMAKLALLGLLITLLAGTFLPWRARSQDEVTWAKRLEAGKEVVTTLQFYFHDVVSGSSATAVKIAQASNGTALSLFGNLLMVDDALTVGPDPNSKVIGRARGMYGSASQSVLDMGLIMVMSYAFTDGLYDGSSFSLLSINPALHRVREMAIVGGTGLFRLARGYAMAQTYSFNTAGDAIVHYNVTLCTYI